MGVVEDWKRLLVGDSEGDWGGRAGTGVDRMGVLAGQCRWGVAGDFD